MQVICDVTGFCFLATARSEIYTLSLHDALPILDNLILQFNGTAAGRALIAAYQASRVVRDLGAGPGPQPQPPADRKSTRLNSSHVEISYAVFCLKKKRNVGANSCLRLGLITLLQ